MNSSAYKIQSSCSMFFHVGNCFQLQKNRTRPCIWAITINEMVMCSIKQRGHRHWNPEGAGNTNLELSHIRDMSALLLTPWGWSCHRGIWCNKVVASRRCFLFFLSEPIDLIFVPPTCVQVAGPLLKFKFPIAKLPYHGLHHSLCATFSNSAEDRTHVHPITQHLRPPILWRVRCD